MKGIEAREALEYGFSKEMLKIYATLLVADITLVLAAWFGTNWALRGGTAGFIGQVLAVFLVLTGFFIGVAGFVAFIYKVVADSNRRAR